MYLDDRGELLAQYGTEQSCGVSICQPGNTKVRGESQELLESTDLDLLDLTPDMVVGADKRVYEGKFGLINCLAPTKPIGDDPKVYVRTIDWSSFPPLEELAWLFDNFFANYDREVVMLMGKKRDGSGWLYHVPEQVGTGGSVKWNAGDDEMGEFQEQAQWVGTLHVHPGTGCDPSQTDVDDWAEPEKSGLHVVFGRDGSYSISGAIAGQTFPLSEGVLTGWDRVKVEYTTSQGRTLEELLKKPKPKPKPKPDQRTELDFSDVERPWSDWKPPELDESEAYVVDPDVGDETVHYALIQVGALCLHTQHALKNLRIVELQGRHYILTDCQWTDLLIECCGVCPIPKSRKLKIRLGKGGK